MVGGEKFFGLVAIIIEQGFTTGAAIDLPALRNRKSAMLCSIGSPDTFARTLDNLSVAVEKQFIFMDHYYYTPGDIRSMVNILKSLNIGTIITTEKDRAKLEGLQNEFPSGIRLLSLRIKIAIDNEGKQLIERITRLL